MIEKHLVGPTPIQILPPGERRSVVLQNQSDSDIYFAAEGSASVTVESGESPGIRLAPGAMFTAVRPRLGETALNLSWWAVSSSPDKALVVIHW